MRAVSSILQRSERQDEEKVVKTFVNAGVLFQLNNLNNQILYGRRGTGKTHVLKVLKTELEKDANNHVLYLDMRTLGSTAQFSDTTSPIRTRCTCLFRDILAELHDSLQKRAVNYPPAEFNTVMDTLRQLHTVSVASVERRIIGSQEQKEAKEVAKKESDKFEVSEKGFKLSASEEEDSKDKQETTSKYTFESEDKVIFPELNFLLQSLTSKLSIKFYVLLDEWSSIPNDLQPFLAEFVKRGMIAIREVVLKIASLEYRSNFGYREENGNFFGIEVGSDVSAGLDIDDYFIYDRNPKAIADMFAQILFRHLDSAFPEDGLANELKIRNHEEMQTALFTNKNVFNQLVRAAEGIPRDLINIFTQGYFDSHRRGRETIDQNSVTSAAKQWFEKDKQKNLDQELMDTLRRIVDEVIGKRRARAFLIPSELEKHKLIQRLFDARVLHLMHRGYADKDNPGRRYNIYALDYGTYVELINTTKRPQLELVELDDASGDDVVPFDDRRSIRRIILSEEMLTPLPF